MHYTVLAASKSKGIGNGLTYESDQTLHNGSIVQVSLRKQIVEGVVIQKNETITQEYDLKSIHQILSEKLLLTEAQILTAKWMAEYYCCTLRHAMSVFLPPPPWRHLLAQDISGYRLINHQELKGAKQQSVCDYLHGKDWVSWDELRTETGATLATMKTLVEKQIVVEEIRKEEIQKSDASTTVKRPVLSNLQQAAYEEITKSDKPSLLFGITGSGKTEIYATFIADVLDEGKQAMVLVPEILLTEHSIQRFEQLLDRDQISVLHSKLTPAEKRREWKRIHNGGVKLVIGSRSALFAPLHDLGLVVIDEEHEWTYKNEQMPRYHTRETAEELCKHAGARFILGSATPSLEAWNKAKTHQYQLVRLAERYGEQSLPSVSVVDLAAVQFGKSYPFSATLFKAIEDRLQKKEQTVLFLNRRGLATSLLCLDCRRRVVSPESNLPFTVHRNESGKPYLQDHTTGTLLDVPETCPHCSGTKLHPVGAGTQRIEEILQQQFPKARILRADRDTLSEPEHMRDLLNAMKNNEADILLGTQSVVKGLDLPNVTLAAVLVADVGLSLPHFRAGERVFQLLTQLTGRSGRSKPGDVIIQTFRPDAPEVKLAAFHKTEEYIEAELKLRTAMNYPPASQVIRLIFRGPEAMRRAQAVAEILQSQHTDHHIGVSPTLFGGGREWHILIRGAHPRSVIQKKDLMGAVVDVDPIDCI